MYSYLLLSDGKSYIGATVDLDKRLRQHNGELAGGAKYTKGRKWNRIVHVRGFVCWKDVLRFEWWWKKYSRRKKGDVIERRLYGLWKCMERFNEFDLEVVIEDSRVEDTYYKIGCFDWAVCFTQQ